MAEHVPPQISATSSHTWLGIMKNETGGSHLVYDDGSPFVDFGGPAITMNENTMCMYNPSAWNDHPCSNQKDIICEFDCQNLNDN